MATASIGLPELLVILFFVALIAAPFVLRRKLPSRPWLGLPLAFVLGPWGHWYVTGGTRHVLGLWVLAVLLGITLESALLSWAIVGIVSTYLMSRRFSRAARSSASVSEPQV